MHILHDDDEWETVSESRPCTSCNGDPKKCNGMCNGSASISLRRRSPEDVVRIKAERRRQRLSRWEPA